MFVVSNKRIYGPYMTPLTLEVWMIWKYGNMNETVLSIDIYLGIYIMLPPH